MRYTIILISLITACNPITGESDNESKDPFVAPATVGTMDRSAFEDALAQLDEASPPMEISQKGDQSGSEQALILAEAQMEGADSEMHGHCGPDLVAVNVRHGENLSLLAGWTGVPAEEIALYSGVHVQDTLYAGQELLIPLDEDSAAGLKSTRNRFEDGRLDRWLERHGGLLAVTALPAATGQTVSSMAKENGDLPIWVVAAFNRGRDLDRLGIGDEVYVPVVGSLLEMPNTEDEVEVPQLESVASVSAKEAGSGQP